MARKASMRGQATDKGKLYLNALNPEANVPQNLPIKVKCLVRFASDRRIALISRDGNESLNGIFGDDKNEQLSRRKLQQLISHFKLENPKQLKGKMVAVLTMPDCSTIVDIFVR